MPGFGPPWRYIHGVLTIFDGSFISISPTILADTISLNTSLDTICVVQLGWLLDRKRVHLGNN